MKVGWSIFIAAVLNLSCSRSKTCDKPDPNCSNIECFAYFSYLDFKIVDKTTGVDLVFGNNSKYTANDIKLYGDAARNYPIPVIVDNANQKFHIMNARQEMYLVVKGTDVYKLTVEFRSKSCCSSVVKTLWQDGVMICSCCNDVISIGVN